MKRVLITLGILAGLFAIWQLFLRRDPTAAAIEKEAKAKDQFGRQLENMQLANRPRLADPARIDQLAGVTAGWMKSLFTGGLADLTPDGQPSPEASRLIWGVPEKN